MSKLKYTIIALFILLVCPVTTNAKEKVTIYMFSGDGCPRCAEAKEYFQSIEKTHGQYFKIKEYEVWYNAKNKILFQKAAKVMNEEAGGVPYIIIGKKTFKGYTSSWNADFISAIMEEYNNDNRLDLEKEMAKIKDDEIQVPKVETEKEDNSKYYILLVILVLVGGAFIFWTTGKDKKNA